MKGWRKSTLGELTDNFDALRIPVKEHDRKPGPYPYYGASGIADYIDRYIFEGEYLLVAEDGENLRTCRTPIAFLASGKFWVNNHAHVLRGKQGVADTRFLMYALWATDITGYLTGSTMPKLTQANMDRIQLTIPPLSEQRAIAHILGTLDDKIELNRKMNQTLEALAQTEFKRMMGESAGREVVLGEICEVAIGGDWGEDEPSDDSVETICLRGVDLEHLRKTGYADAPRRWVKQSKLLPRRLDERDVLVAASGLGPTGRSLWACVELEKVFGMPVTYSNFCKRFRCRTPPIAAFVDRHLHYMRQTGEIWDYVNGTSIPNLDAKGLLTSHRLILPPEAALHRFYTFIKQITQKLYSKESRTLAALRDALLPKLISGEIRVRDAERFLKERGL